MLLNALIRIFSNSKFINRFIYFSVIKRNMVGLLFLAISLLLYNGYSIPLKHHRYLRKDDAFGIFIFSILLIILTEFLYYLAKYGWFKDKNNQKMEPEISLIEKDNFFKLKYKSKSKRAFKRVKNELYHFYKKMDLSKVIIDKENSFMLKHNTEKDKYIYLI